ncbi:MAG TPA: hypothetical protein VGB98_26355 [Pyrinomonadaceae bacterium]|jgi:tetratricopeptide (TPR) repeat protein
MKVQIEKALSVKDLAVDERDARDLGEALTLIDEAIEPLEELWAQKGEAIDAAGAGASPDERDLVAALAETYGVKGGILRSSGDPENAVRAYDKGLDFERHPARRVDSSYNLVQGLTNRVLAAPGVAGAAEWEVLSKDMWRELEEAGREIQRQLEGSRRNDPWAAADMLTVKLLLAPRDPRDGARKVEQAYAEFEELKPKASVYESTLRALNDLKDCLERVDEDERSENLKVIVGQLGSITGRLREGAAEAKGR